jgi:hypothetical protein
VAGATGVCSGAGAGAGADVSAGLVSFGTMALSWQPMTDKDKNIRDNAISLDRLFFTFLSSFLSYHLLTKILKFVSGSGNNSHDRWKY